MLKPMLRAISLLVCMGAALNVSANDSTATLGAGGIVFDKTDAIAMDTHSNNPEKGSILSPRYVDFTTKADLHVMFMHKF